MNHIVDETSLNLDRCWWKI